MTANPFTIAPEIRALLLVRVSTKDQAGERKATRRGKLVSERSEKVSDRLQEEKCRALAREILPNITEAEILLRPDLGVSGLKEERLEEIVAACEKSPRTAAAPGYVLALNVSRFCRLEMLRAMGYLDRLDRAGWFVRFDFPRRSGTLMADNLMLAVLIEMAAEYSRGLKENVAPAMRSYAERGEVQGGRPLPGFTVDADGHYVPKPDSDPDVKMVRRAFADVAAGTPLYVVAQRAGVHATTMARRLSNPAYIGTLSWGRRKRSKQHSEKPGAHPALIDRATWDVVQRRLGENGTRPARRPDGLPFVLSGRVRGSCGHYLQGAGGVPKHATAAERLKWSGYRCKDCRRDRVNQVRLEAAVLSTVVQYLRQEDDAGRLEARMEKWVAAQLSAGSTAELERKRQVLEDRKARLLDLAELQGDRDVAKRLAAITGELARLERPAKPDAKAIKAAAARTLAETRAFVAQGANVTPQAANASLGRLLDLIPAISYDAATGLVEVSFLSPFETLTALVDHADARSECRAQ